MRFGKFVQVAIGFAAASGAFLLLSSNALAADAGSVTSSQPHLNGLTSDHSDTPNSPQAPTDITSNTGSITTNLPSAPTASALAPGNEVSTSGTSTTTSSLASTSAVTDTSSSNGPKSAINGIAPTDGSGNSGSGGGASDSVQGLGTTVAGANQTPVTGITTETPTADPILSSPLVSSAAVPTAIHYRSALLAVQPTIITRDDVTETDLASAVPSAPTPTKVPGSPTKSSGAALERLTSSLETSIVPPAFFPSVSLFEELKLILLLLVIAVAFAKLVGMTYGEWLRKGGYATAARSDAPATVFTSLFATPFLLGYVSAPPRSHGPSLMVSNYKIQTTQFPTFSERRKNI